MSYAAEAIMSSNGAGGDWNVTAAMAHDGQSVRVVARMVGVASRWALPYGPEVRAMADKVAKTYGVKRAGRRSGYWHDATRYIFVFPVA